MDKDDLRECWSPEEQTQLHLWVVDSSVVDCKEAGNDSQAGPLIVHERCSSGNQYPCFLVKGSCNSEESSFHKDEDPVFNSSWVNLAWQLPWKGSLALISLREPFWCFTQWGWSWLQSILALSCTSNVALLLTLSRRFCSMGGTYLISSTWEAEAEGPRALVGPVLENETLS